MKLWLKIEKLCDFIKELMKDRHIFKKGLVFATTESSGISNSLVNNSTIKLQKVSCKSGSKRSFGHTNTCTGARFSASHALNFQGRKKTPQY